jgi:hypothetical protein
LAICCCCCCCRWCCRRVANIYFTLVAALSLTPYSPVRCAALVQQQMHSCCWRAQHGRHKLSSRMVWCMCRVVCK